MRGRPPLAYSAAHATQRFRRRTGGVRRVPDADYLACRRSQMEAMALAYLGEYNYTDIPVRFDMLSLVPVGSDKALLRHQINALGCM